MEFIKLLGVGGNAKVYKAIYKKKRKVAVKVLKEDNSCIEEDFQKEYNIFRFVLFL